MSVGRGQRGRKNRPSERERMERIEGTKDEDADPFQPNACGQKTARAVEEGEVCSRN